MSDITKLLDLWRDRYKRTGTVWGRCAAELEAAMPAGTIFDSEDESTWPDDKQTVLYRYRNKAKGWVSYLSLFQFLLHISHLPDGVGNLPSLCGTRSSLVPTVNRAKPCSRI